MKRKTKARSKPTGTAERERAPEQPDASRATGPSATAVAGEAIRTGVVPFAAGDPPPDEVPREEELRVGDPDVSTLGNTYVGDEAPGGDMPTPDQANVDEIGSAMGVADADAGELRSSTELLERRDQRRADLDPADKPAPKR